MIQSDIINNHKIHINPYALQISGREKPCEGAADWPQQLILPTKIMVFVGKKEK
jgi:hypothetical protein